MAKVMLVEDDNNLREIYEARLAAEGYEIVSAQDGEEALALAVKERPDLIIADVMMPKVSGFDMLDILRSTPETKHTRIIMMTALSQAEDKTRAEKLGADRYLVKSQVTLEDVVKVASEILAEAGAMPPAAETAAAAATPSVNLPAPVDPSASSPSPSATPAPEPSAPPADTSTSTPSVPTTTANIPVATAPTDDAATTATPPAPSDDATTTPTSTTTPPEEKAEDKTKETPATPATEASTPAAEEEAVVSKQIEDFIAGNPTLTTSAETPKADQPTSAPSAPEVSTAPEASSTDSKPAESPTPEPAPTEPSGLVEEVITTPSVSPAPAPEPAPTTPTKTTIPVTMADETPEPAAPAPAGNDADQTMAKAMDSLLGDKQPESTTEPKSTEEPAAADAEDDGPKAAPKRGGERVIAPLSDPRDTGPDLSELLAKEEANEGLATPTVNSVIAPDGTVTSTNDVAPKSAESFDASPGSVVQAPGTQVQPPSGENPSDPNSIAL